jgi:CRP/FNR family transcriptional regulator, anaerobic regulatory protein
MTVSVIPRNLGASTELAITQAQSKPDRPQARETIIELLAPVRHLNPGEVLFGAGDRKTHLYRVESGCLCVYEAHSTEHRVVIDFAFAGDLLGLGYLDSHTRSARAIGETKVTCLPLAAVDRIIEADSLARDHLQQAIDDELEFVRDSLVKSGRRNPIARVAAFLVALSRANSYEGRNQNIITDSVKCGVVASYLALSVDALARVLVEFEERGLIESCTASALRLHDIAALEQLADGHDAFASCTRPN